MNPYLVTIVLSVPIIAVTVMYALKRGNKLREQGLITARPSQFVEREYTYASPMFDFNQLLDAIRQIDLDAVGAKVGWTASRSQRMVEFDSPSNEYKALLCTLEDANGEHRFQFSFLKWATHNGRAQNTESMNRLMTALEKAMLGLDPYVTVRSELVATKSKARIW